MDTSAPSAHVRATLLYHQCIHACRTHVRWSGLHLFNNNQPPQPLLLPDSFPLQDRLFPHQTLVLPPLLPVPAAVTAPKPAVAHGPQYRAVNEYERILSRVNAGSSLTDALQAEHLFMSLFSRMRFVVEAAKVDLAAVCTPGWNSSAQKPDPKARVPCCTEHYKKLAEQRNLHAAGDALLLKKKY